MHEREYTGNGIQQQAVPRLSRTAFARATAIRAIAIEKRVQTAHAVVLHHSVATIGQGNIAYRPK